MVIILWTSPGLSLWAINLDTCLTVEFKLDTSLMLHVNLLVADIQQFSYSCEDHDISALCCVRDMHVKQ